MAWVVIVVVVAIICLALIIAAKKRGALREEKGALPYVRKEALLTPAERSFLGVLEQAVAGKYRIYAQVRMADLVAVKPGTEKSARSAAQNRINSKHTDFVICRADTLGIVCAIELDDSSREKASRKLRDGFVEAAFESAGLPLLRFPAKSSYQAQEVRSALAAVLGSSQESAPAPSVPEPAKPVRVAPATTLVQEQAAPPCPKCGGQTVARTVKSGAHAGSRLWGCKSYPACRGYIPLNT